MPTLHFHPSLYFWRGLHIVDGQYAEGCVGREHCSERCHDVVLSLDGPHAHFIEPSTRERQKTSLRIPLQRFQNCRALLHVHTPSRTVQHQLRASLLNPVCQLLLDVRQALCRMLVAHGRVVRAQSFDVRGSILSVTVGSGRGVSDGAVGKEVAVHVDGGSLVVWDHGANGVVAVEEGRDELFRVESVKDNAPLAELQRDLVGIVQAEEGQSEDGRFSRDLLLIAMRGERTR